MLGENIMIINQNAAPLPAALRGSDAAVIVPLLLRATTGWCIQYRSKYQTGNNSNHHVTYYQSNLRRSCCILKTLDMPLYYYHIR
jgi:hypothetical protein